MKFDEKFNDRLRSNKYAMIEIAFNENHEMSNIYFKFNVYDFCESADLVNLNFIIFKLR